MLEDVSDMVWGIGWTTVLRFWERRIVDDHCFMDKEASPEACGADFWRSWHVIAVMKRPRGAPWTKGKLGRRLLAGRCRALGGVIKCLWLECG